MRELTNEQRKLRRRFKAWACQENPGTHFIALDAYDISQLSPAQVIKLIRFIRSDEFKIHGEEKQSLMLDSLISGILTNDDLREWYYHMYKQAKEMGAETRPSIWLQQEDEESRLYTRLHDAVDVIRREDGMEDFLLLRKMLDKIVFDRMQSAGLRPSRQWQEDRFMRALFPRILSLKEIFRECGDKKDLAVPFRERVEKAFHLMPDFVRDFIYASGYTIRVALRLGHIDPKYAHERINSDRSESFEQSACGVHTGRKLYIDIPEYLHHEKEGGAYVNRLAHRDDEELAVTQAHEAGHAIVAAQWPCVLHDPVFVAAYEKDIEMFSKSDTNGNLTKQYGYYLPKILGGYHENIAAAREEALVELMGELMLREKGLLRGELYIHMPRTRDFALQMLETARIDHEINRSGADYPDLHALEAYTRNKFLPEACLKSYRMGEDYKRKGLRHR